MASGVVSKNLYEILGNDPELDPERKQPEPPVKTVDKPAARHGKRDGPAELPVRDSAPARGGRGGGRGGREQGGSSDLAFRDRGAGSYQNRQRPTDEFCSDRQSNRPQDGEQKQGAGRGRGRGQGRGGRGGGRDDRHSRTGVTDSDKQAGHGWGENTGEAELADETTGEAIAQADAKQAATEVVDGAVDPVTADDAAEEAEDKTKSYDAYLAEQKEKRAALGAGLEIRKPNEGNSKKLPEGKAVEREEEEAYFAGAAQKAKRERARKERNVLELDNERLHSAPQESFRGGRGRGGRGRGDREGGRGDREGGRGDRGDRGDREGGRGRGDGPFRGEGRGRGGRGGRGGERGGERGGDFRGGRGGGRGGNAPNTADAKQFPSLGA